MKNNIIAFIPARSGSKRIPNKNIKDFFGYPLIVYTIQSAKDSGIFDEIIVSSDDFYTGSIAVYQGVGYIDRPREYATDISPDIDWIKHAIGKLKEVNKEYDYFAILRPTNPFRSRETIKKGYDLFLSKKCGSVRAVERVKQHPYKMWRIYPSGKLVGLLGEPRMPEAYDKPTQTLPTIYVQNGCLQISKINGLKQNSVSEWPIYPLIIDNYEGFDINTPEDWILAEEFVKRGLIKLPEIK